MKFRLVEENALKDPEVQKTISELPKDEQEVTKTLVGKLNWDPIDNANEIMNELDSKLKMALRAKRRGYESAETAGNLLLVGGAGTAKSSSVRTWAQARGINLLSKNLADMDRTDFGGGVTAKVDDKGQRTNTMTRLTNDEFDSLDEPNSVLFLDEMNRTDPDVVAAVLKLVLDHQVTDNNSKGGNKTFKGYLFTVGAINPAAEGVYSTAEFDPAVLDRFDQFPVFPDITQYRKYLISKLNRDLETDTRDYKKTGDETILQDITETKGRINLANTILSDPLFEFDDIDDEIAASQTRQEGKYKILQTKTTSPRGFAALIEACDGTKDDLLNKWNRFCNFTKKDTIEQILTNYKDIDDKANDALRYKNGFLDGEEEESIFQDSAWDKLSGML